MPDDLANAWGLAGGAQVASFTYACLEDSMGDHTPGAALIGPLLCSSYASCPSNHRTQMDQMGTACGPNSRKSICACQ